MQQAVIKGTGSYLPTKKLSNHELPQELNTTHEWIYSRTGIKNRHIASKTETTSFMAAAAAAIAFEESKVEKIDLIIAATCTADRVFPSVATYVQQQLKLSGNIPAFDVNAACSGFIYAMDIAWQYIKSGAANNVLVIGSESMSQAVDWNDRATCVLFGDGAGAVVLGASAKPGILGSSIKAMYDEQEFLTYENRSFIKMHGSEVFKIAVKYMSNIVDVVLEKANFVPKKRYSLACSTSS